MTHSDFPGRGEAGAVAVELALAIPFLLIVLVSVVDLGFLIRDHQILENAAREGARYSALTKNWVDPRNPGASIATIQDQIIDYCSDAGITVAASDITIDQDHEITVGARTMTASRVTVSIDRDPLTPMGATLTGGQVRLTGEAVFRNFY